VTQGDTSRFRKLDGFFDIVAADVPCSGEGMMRKDAEAVAQWSPALVAKCASLQREIVSNLWNALTPGGYFIYSTCTFNRSEDEDNLHWMVDELGAEPVDMQFPSQWMIAAGINTEIPCYRFLPHRLRGEGLFIGVMRKPGERAKRRDQRMPKPSKPDKNLAAVERWLRADAEMSVVADGERIVALPQRWLTEIAALRKVAHCIYYGVAVAAVKGRDLIPDHALAMSDLIADDVFPTAEVDYTTAVAYLRREAVAVPDGDTVTKGYVILTYGGKPLGWVKHLGNRANNLYPQPLRILSSHAPEIRPLVVTCR
jgi:NOL1/NOP2/fmu family ribosome biogenesis protein